MPLDVTGRALRARLLDFFAQPFDAPPDDNAFDALARDVFAWQFEHNRPLAAWWTRRGALPHRITHWTEIPAVPTAAFKEVPLVAGDARDAEMVFRTSGTTRGAERRGEHHVIDRSLYHAALLPIFDAWVLPDGAHPAMLSLMPHARDLPDSSLAHMITVIVERRGAAGSGWFADADAGLAADALDTALLRCIDENRPVCLLGTSSAFVHWLELIHQRGAHYLLPPGSRLMDTGGFKGSGREFVPAQIRTDVAERLAIPDTACVNEYGMTEMLSQFYDSTLRRRGPRRKVPPPWVRTRIVDADTLRPRSDDAPGLLQHFDLANLGSALAIQTLDIGRPLEDGFEVLGRATGATPRGCSIAMDELLSAARDAT